MNEERRVGADIAQAFVIENGTPPCVPRGGGNRMSAGTYGHQIHEHKLAVGIPTVRQKSVLGRPPMRDRAAAVEHPKPVNAIENLGSEFANLRIRKIFSAGEDAAEQQSGVDGGNFALEGALAGVNVDKVIEEAALVVHARGKEFESCAHAANNGPRRNKAALIGDAKGGKSKAGRWDAGDVVVVEFAGRTAILGKARVGIGLLPEIQAG